MRALVKSNVTDGRVRYGDFGRADTCHHLSLFDVAENGTELQGRVQESSSLGELFGEITERVDCERDIVIGDVTMQDIAGLLWTNIRSGDPGVA